MQKLNLLLMVLIFAACTASNKTEETIVSNTSADTTTKATTNDTITVAPITLQSPIVAMDLSDDGNYYTLTKEKNIDSNAIKPALIVNALNSKWSKVQLVLTKVSNDTVYVSIPNSTYLTQQMGSSGAEVFLVNAVYNITEVKGIRYVNFDFEEGDHLLPGTFGRKDFKDKVKQK